MRLLVIIVVAIIIASVILDWLQFKFSQNVDRDDWSELESYADRYRADVDSTISRHVDSEEIVDVDRDE